MLRTTLANVSVQRTIRPLYAFTQATPYAGFLDPAWDKSVDIYPGMVMAKLDQEKFTLLSNTTHEPFGLSALFLAPVLGIDEVTPSGTNNFTAWRLGGADATFEILAPAFAASATWANPTDGSRTPLRVTLTGHADGPGKLTPEAAGANVSTKVAATLISVVGTNKIVVSLDNKANG